MYVCRGGDGSVWRSKGTYSLTKGHIWSYQVWMLMSLLQPSCRGCRQKPTNVSSSKTHKSQEPCLMAHQHKQKARGHLDGTSLVLCKLTFGGCLHRTCTM